MGFAKLSPETSEDPLESPEILIINALLEDPDGFVPERYGLAKEMLSCYQKPWSFCAEHQRSEGCAPSRELFSRTFPDFELLSGVRPSWAAGKLKEAHHNRTIRKRIQESLYLLNQGDAELAQAQLQDFPLMSALEVPAGLDVFDPAVLDDDKHKTAYPTPWDYLTVLTRGGVGLGELWYIGARFGQGKSFIVPCMGVALAQAGADVAMCTLEMPKRTYVRRIHNIMTSGDSVIQSRMASPDRQVRQEALAAVPKMAGKLRVFDPSDMTMDVRAIRRLAMEYQYVCIDHMGLMLSRDGTPAIKDWRVAAEISNESKRITLEENSGIVGAIQINREGESQGFLPPKTNSIAGTDELGRDADVLVLMRRMQERSMLMDVPKNRLDRSGRFYTKFDPDSGDFGQISKDEALDRAKEDEQRLADI